MKNKKDTFAKEEKIYLTKEEVAKEITKKETEMLLLNTEKNEQMNRILFWWIPLFLALVSPAMGVAFWTSLIAIIISFAFIGYPISKYFTAIKATKALEVKKDLLLVGEEDRKINEEAEKELTKEIEALETNENTGEDEIDMAEKIRKLEEEIY